MSGAIEHGMCDVCKRSKTLSRKYYHYDVKCDCCGGGKHFELVRYCKDCVPKPPPYIHIALDIKPQGADTPCEECGTVGGGGGIPRRDADGVMQSYNNAGDVEYVACPRCGATNADAD